MHPRLRHALLTALVAPAFALSACGGSSDADQIKGVIQDVAKDSSAICDHASDKLLKAVGTGGVDACKKAARGNPDKSAKKIEGDINVKVDGDTATADFTDNDGKKQHVLFVKDNGDWKVDGAN